MNPTHASTPSAHSDATQPRAADAPTPDLLRPLAAGDDEPVIALLKAGIPLSLLVDLAGSDDLHSREIYQVEGVESDAFAHLHQ